MVRMVLETWSNMYYYFMYWTAEEVKGQRQRIEADEIEPREPETETGEQCEEPDTTGQVQRPRRTYIRVCVCVRTVGADLLVLGGVGELLAGQDAVLVLVHHIELLLVQRHLLLRVVVAGRAEVRVERTSKETRKAKSTEMREDRKRAAENTEVDRVGMDG